MIKFRCDNCGHKIGTKDEHAGKRARCPGCGGVITVPEKTILVNFLCEDCGERISAVHTQAGKEGKCPKCRAALVVPAAHDLTLLDVREQYNLQDHPNSQPRPPEDITELQQEEPAAEKTESDTGRKLPWIIDIFLYPTSAPGLTHLAIFIGIPLLIHLIRQLLGPLGLVLLFPGLVINLLLGFYMCWYFAECVRDSAAGHVRAPEVFADADIGTIFGQWLYLAACYAIFVLPAAFYFTYTNRTDRIFWTLVACGVFFFPMALLTVVMFDTSSAFNPILWIASIFSTFFQYCWLVLFVSGIVLASLALIGIGKPEEAREMGIGAKILGAVFSCLLIYMAFVVAHLLGRFYWRYQERLNWEV